MYTVMIVDDEPAAISYMKKIIEKKCPEFEVIATANDGIEAIDIIKEKKPDVLIADICMPVMNGLEIIDQLKEWDLHTITIIVSGYSEFEYARKALQNGVFDYLLKPVIPEDAKKVFEKIAGILKKDYFENQKRILRDLCKDKEIPKEKINKYFGKQDFYVALSRCDGLPLRFSTSIGREIYSDMNEIIYTYGRDEMENLYLVPENVVNGDFVQFITDRNERDITTHGYKTMTVCSQPIKSEHIYSTVHRMYHVLDQSIVIGENRVINLHKYEEQPITVNAEEKNLLEEIRYYIQKNNVDKTKKLIKNVMELWRVEKKSLVYIERNIRNISALFTLQNENYGMKSDSEIEYAFEDAFYYSQNMEQLTQSIYEILFVSENENKKEERLDTTEFIQKVCNYIQNNLSKALSSQDIAKEFGVSQTYLGKLFRKYKEMSLSECITSMKMEKAKELFSTDKEILVKDVSDRLGYRDQFYFSRVFRTYVGLCPSEYIDNNK